MTRPGRKPLFTAEQRAALRAEYEAIPIGKRGIWMDFRCGVLGCSREVLRRYVTGNKAWANHIVEGSTWNQSSETTNTAQLQREG